MVNALGDLEEARIARLQDEPAHVESNLSEQTTGVRQHLCNSTAVLGGIDHPNARGSQMRGERVTGDHERSHALGLPVDEPVLVKRRAGWKIDRTYPRDHDEI